MGTNVRNYELMVILDPSIDERTVAPTMEKYLAPVAANGGSVENVDIWGKRRLAYDILKRSEGIYVRCRGRRFHGGLHPANLRP